jgi:hypothetical protein
VLGSQKPKAYCVSAPQAQKNIIFATANILALIVIFNINI